MSSKDTFIKFGVWSRCWIFCCSIHSTYCHKCFVGFNLTACSRCSEAVSCSASWSGGALAGALGKRIRSSLAWRICETQSWWNLDWTWVKAEVSCCCVAGYYWKEITGWDVTEVLNMQICLEMYLKQLWHVSDLKLICLMLKIQLLISKTVPDSHYNLKKSTTSEMLLHSSSLSGTQSRAKTCVLNANS